MEVSDLMTIFILGWSNPLIILSLVTLCAGVLTKKEKTHVNTLR